MSTIHLSAFDLNLLVVLDALLATRSTTAAARRLGRTQSGVSHALARLREVLGDPLLVRSGTRLQPTTLALSLLRPLAEALGQVEGIFRGDQAPFDPSKLRRSFAVGATDVFGISVLPLLVAQITKAAPGVDIDVRAGGEQPLEQALERGEIDVAFGTKWKRTALATTDVGHEDMVVILRPGHPAARRKLTLDAYCALKHVVVAPRGLPGSAVDTVLGPLGRTRRVMLRVPHFAAAALVVSRSDLVCTLPRSFVRNLRTLARLVERELPFKSPEFAFQVAVTRARADEPALAWFVGQVAEACRETLR